MIHVEAMIVTTATIIAVTTTVGVVTTGRNETATMITITETGAREVTASHHTQVVIKITETMDRVVMASLTKTMADISGARAIPHSQVKIMVAAVAGAETSTSHKTWAWRTEWAAINKHDLRINKI